MDIYVGNLAYETTAAGLKAAVAEHAGNIRRDASASFSLK